MEQRRESKEERYRRERDECRRERDEFRREIKRYRRERDSYKMKLEQCYAEVNDYVMLSRHLRNHIELVERSAVNAIPVQESVPPELRELIAEPILSGEVLEPEPEPISGEVLEPEPEPETKPEERDLVDEMMKLGSQAGWELPKIPGETWENYFKRLMKAKRGEKSRSWCGSRPRMKKKNTKRRKKNKQTKKYKRLR